MNKKEWKWMDDKQEHCHYSGLPSPSAYGKEKLPKEIIEDDSKDWYLMLSILAIGFITLIIFISLMI